MMRVHFKGRPLRLSRHWLFEEARRIWSLIWPNLVINQCLTFMLISGPIIFAGRIINSTTVLAGVSLCVNFFFIVAFLPLYGVASSLDTLATQAFGAKDYTMLGVYLQRGMLILLFLCLPISAVLLQLEQLLLLIGEDAVIARISANMMLYSLLLLPFLTMVVFVKVAEAQSIVVPAAMLLFLAAILYSLTCVIILYLVSKSVVSLVAASLIAMVLVFILFLVYMYISGVFKRIWGGFTRQAFNSWSEMLILGLPISIGLITDAVIVALGNFLVGLGSTDAAVQISIYSALVCLSDFLELCSYAAFIGISVRVGNLVGEGDVSRSKRAAVTGVILSLVMTGTILLIICIPKNFIGYVFVSDRQVVEGISELVLYLIPTSLLMALVYALNGVLSGYGRQWVIVIQVVVGLLVGLPVSLVLTGYGWGARGYWLGVIAGYIVKSLVALLINFYYLFCARIMRISSESSVAEQTRRETAPLVMKSVATDSDLTYYKHSVKYSNATRTKMQFLVLCKKARLLFMWLIPIVYVLFCVSFFISLLTCKFSGLEHVFHVKTHLKTTVRICCMKFVFNDTNSSSIT